MRLRYIYHDLVPEIRDGSNSNPRSFMIFVTRSLKLKCALNNLKQILHEIYNGFHVPLYNIINDFKKVQVGKDQEKAQSEKDSHSKNRGGKKPN